MQRNRIVKQNTAYLRAQLVAGQPPTREALEAATVAMNAGAHAEQMLQVAAAGNAAPASVGVAAGGVGGDAFASVGAHVVQHGVPLPGNAHAPVLMPAGYLEASRMAGDHGTRDGRGPAMTSSAAAAATTAALGAGAALTSVGAPYTSTPMVSVMSVPRPAAGSRGKGKKAGGAGRGRATNFPPVAAGLCGRGSETSSLTYQQMVGPRVVSEKAGDRSDSPNVSAQSVDAKSYANAVKTRGPRAEVAADAALAAAVAERLSLPTGVVARAGPHADAARAPRGRDALDTHAALRESPIGGASLDRREAALAAKAAARVAAPGGDARGRSLVPRDFDLPGGAASATAAAAVAAQCDLGAQQGSDGSRADAGGGSSGDGSDSAAHGGEGNGSGDVGAQSTRAPIYSLPDDAAKEYHHHREMTHHFLVPSPGVGPGTGKHHSPPTILERDVARGVDEDDEDENDELGTFQDWIVEDGSGSGDLMKSPPDTRPVAQKIGRTDSMNRVASMERMAKRSARGEAA